MRTEHTRSPLYGRQSGPTDAAGSVFAYGADSRSPLTSQAGRRLPPSPRPEPTARQLEVAYHAGAASRAQQRQQNPYANSAEHHPALREAWTRGYRSAG